MDILKPPRTSASEQPRAEFLRLPDVLAIIPVSKSTWWEGVRSGRYPTGVKLSARTTAWRRSDIEELVDKLAGKTSPNQDRDLNTAADLRAPKAQKAE